MEKNRAETKEQSPENRSAAHHKERKATSCKRIALQEEDTFWRDIFWRRLPYLCQTSTSGFSTHHQDQGRALVNQPQYIPSHPPVIISWLCFRVINCSYHPNNNWPPTIHFALFLSDNRADSFHSLQDLPSPRLATRTILWMMMKHFGSRRMRRKCGPWFFCTVSRLVSSITSTPQDSISHLDPLIWSTCSAWPTWLTTTLPED